MYSFVDTTNTTAHAVLNIPGQLHAFLHVLTLNKLKHDIALRRLRIKSGIGLPIILFHRNHRVLTHSHVQIVLSPVHTQGIGLETSRSEERRVGKECRSRWSPYH